MALRSHLYIFLRVLHTFASSILATPNSTCYSPDGNIVTEVDIQPCIQIDGVASMGCATNRTSIPDICMTNGLCQNGDTFWRDYCNDPTWLSPNCLPKTTCGNSVYTQMTFCTDGSWCCGIQNYTDCCDMGLGFSLADNLVEFKSSGENVATASQLPTTTSSPNSPATTSSFTTLACDTRSGIRIETGAVIGIGVGFGILVIFGTIGVFFAGLRRGKISARKNNNYLLYNSGNTSKKPDVVFKEKEMHEMQGTPIAELEECSSQ